MKIPTIKQYISLPANKKKTLLESVIAEYLSSEYVLASINSKNCLLPTNLNRNLQIYFSVVFSGTFIMGLSEYEEKAIFAIDERPNLTLDWLKPAYQVAVAPFIISSVPVIADDYIRNTEKAIDVLQKDHSPIFLDYKSGEEFCRKFNFRLPTEKEWEYVCRAGTQTLFTWGNQILPDEKLEKWLTSDFFVDAKGEYFGFANMLERSRLMCNAFGMYGLFSCEWCSDFFTESHSCSSKPIQEHVIRGGGAMFWPWQSDEWTWCISAGRQPESYGCNGTAAFRLVKSFE